MTYDQLCQDMYRLRMMLQKAQTNGNDLAEQAAVAMNKHKQVMHTLQLRQAFKHEWQLCIDSSLLHVSPVIDTACECNQ
jgi:hypothetical protein